MSRLATATRISEKFFYWQYKRSEIETVLYSSDYSAKHRVSNAALLGREKRKYVVIGVRLKSLNDGCLQSTLFKYASL